VSCVNEFVIFFICMSGNLNNDWPGHTMTHFRLKLARDLSIFVKMRKVSYILNNGKTYCSLLVITKQMRLCCKVLPEKSAK